MTTDACIALSDAQLVDKTYDVVCDVMELDERRGEVLAELVSEVLERFAPEAARAELIRLYEASRLKLHPNLLLDDLESLRQRQAARLLRDTLKAK